MRKCLDIDIAFGYIYYMIATIDFTESCRNLILACVASDGVVVKDFLIGGITDTGVPAVARLADGQCLRQLRKFFTSKSGEVKSYLTDGEVLESARSLAISNKFIRCLLEKQERRGLTEDQIGWLHKLANENRASLRQSYTKYTSGEWVGDQSELAPGAVVRSPDLGSGVVMPGSLHLLGLRDFVSRCKDGKLDVFYQNKTYAFSLVGRGKFKGSVSVNNPAVGVVDGYCGMISVHGSWIAPETKSTPDEARSLIRALCSDKFKVVSQSGIDTGLCACCGLKIGDAWKTDIKAGLHWACADRAGLRSLYDAVSSAAPGM